MYIIRVDTVSVHPTHPQSALFRAEVQLVRKGIDSKYREIGPLKMTRIKYQKKNLGLILLLELLREYRWGVGALAEVGNQMTCSAQVGLILLLFRE